MKTKLFTFFLALAASIGIISAWDVQSNGLYFNLNTSNKTAEVTSQNSKYPYWSNTITTANIPSVVTYNGKYYIVTSIGKSAFDGCSALTSISIPSSVTKVELSAFSGCNALPIIDTLRYADTYLVEAVDKTLSTYTIKNGTRWIGSFAFQSCISMTAIEIPNSIISIGYRAFGSCINLTSVTIPNSVTSIEDYAFSGCSSLNSIEFLSENPPSLGRVAFPEQLSSIYVPCGSLDIYKTASGWDYYASKIKYKPLPYHVQFDYNKNQGHIENSIENTICDTIFTVIAVPQDGYYFVKWEDESVESTRVVHLTQDTIISAEFAIFLYSVSVSSNILQGRVDGDNGQFEHGTKMTYYAVPNYGYHFTQWSDGNTDNPRTIVLTQDTTIEALFAKNAYTIHTTADHGTIVVADSTPQTPVPPVRVQLPNVPFEFDFDATNFDAQSLTVSNHPNANLAQYQLQFQSGMPTLVDSCLSVSTTCKGYINKWAFESSSAGQYFARKNSDNMTIICKVAPKSGGKIYDIITDRGTTSSTDNYNYMFRVGDQNSSYLHTATSYSSSRAISLDNNSPQTIVCRVNGQENYIVLENKTTGAQKQFSGINWGGTNNTTFKFFYDLDNEYFRGDFYWIYYSFNYLSDEDVQQVIDYHNNVSNIIPSDTVSLDSCQYEYESILHLAALPDYGYHFAQWNDSVTDNPRVIELTQDTAFSVNFGKNPVITYVYDSEMGKVFGDTTFAYSGTGTIVATVSENYGYHFVQWSDGNINNPRTIEVTQDTTIEAIFSKNVYTIAYMVDSVKGSVQGLSQAKYLDSVTMTAIPNYGYHFTQWSDGNTDNPRTIVVTHDSTFTALYEPNKYNLSFICNIREGGVRFPDKYEYLSEVNFTAVPFYGYHFTQWADGNTDNPRTIVITQDTTFEALFAKNMYSIEVTVDSFEWGSISGTGSFEYLTECELLATPYYGYHFVRWIDSAYYDNPQNITTVAQAYSIASALAKNEVTDSVYTIIGYITGNYGNYTNSYYLSDSPDTPGTFVIFKAANSANIGDYIMVTSKLQNYLGIQPETVQGGQLTKLSEYIYTANPLAITLKKDISLVAEFAKNIYTLSIQTADETMGSVSAGGDFEYLSTHVIEASSNYGYRFTGWSDGDMNNPRTIVLASDTTFTATFAKNPVITYIYDHTMGTIVGDTTLASEASGEVTFEAVPNYGYHFTHWADGSTENPRTIMLTENVTYEALFAVDRSGTCGVDNQLTWQYSPSTKTLTISGNGSLSTNCRFGVEAPVEMQNLYIGNNITEIGSYAFYSMTTINHLVIGGGVTYIGSYAFAECKNFDDITCYATTVPTITSTTFANVGNKQYIYLYVPEGRERAYLRDTYWGEFDIKVQEAETVTEPVGEVSVEPTDNTAVITWPAVNEAETYEMAITKDGEVVCTLIFNANGQLTGIAFAPSRNGTNNAQQEQVTGFRFTVTGLTSNTNYGYSITSKDATETTIDTKSGQFTTTGEMPEGIDDISLEDIAPRKVMIDNVIYILRGDKTYTITGQEVR